MRKKLKLPDKGIRLRNSLQAKWTAVLMLLVLAVLTIVGIFLLGATANYYINQFRSEVGTVFTTDFLEELNQADSGTKDNAVTQVSSALDVYSGPLGIGAGREYYILDAETGDCLAASEVAFDGTTPKTSNVVTAMNGEVGEDISIFGRTMDLAIPVSGVHPLVVRIADNRTDMRHMCWLMFLVILAALIIGLAASAALGMVLIRTVTDPIAELNRGAKRFADGDYDQKLTVQDPDEIGQLTESFNEIGTEMRRAMTIVQLERARLRLLGGYLQDGLVTCAADGEILSMNEAAEELLGCTFAEGMPFSALFPDVPFPDSDEGAVFVDFTANGQELCAVFATDEDRGFTAVIVPVEEQA